MMEVTQENVENIMFVHYNPNGYYIELSSLSTVTDDHNSSVKFFLGYNRDSVSKKGFLEQFSTY